MQQSASPAGSTRRRVLAVGTLGGIVVALAPRMAIAKPEDVAAAIKKLYGDKAIAVGKVKLEMPQIAENGNVVPMTGSVDSPMTDGDYVKAVHVFAEGNPLPSRDIRPSSTSSTSASEASASARLPAAATS